MVATIVGTNVRKLLFEKQAREQRRISGRKFAIESGIPESTVVAYLHNDVKRFDSDTIIKMMAYFGLKSFDELFVKLETVDEKQ